MSDLIGFYPDLVRQGIFKGVNLVPLVERFWYLTSMVTPVPPPVVRWNACKNPMRSVAWPGRISMRLDSGRSIEWVVEALLHELVHCSLPPKTAHSEIFCRRLIAAACEAFGLTIDVASFLALPRGDRACRAYAIDDAIVAVMKAGHFGAKLRGDVEVWRPCAGRKAKRAP